MFRLTRLSNEHATIPSVLESADMSVGATSYGQQNRTSENENCGDRTHRQCNDFCVGTSRHSNNRLPPTDIPKGNGCSFEDPKIQSHGGRPEGYIDEHAGIPYYPEITIVGLRFTSTVARSRNVAWSSATGKVKHWRWTRTVGTYVYNNKSSMCIPSYSPRYATAQKELSDHFEWQYQSIYGVVRSRRCPYQPYKARRRREVRIWSMSQPIAESFLNSFWAQGDRSESLTVEA